MRFDRSKWSKCPECPLRERNRVWSEGPGQGPVPIVLMGEGPGRDEDFEGRPFVGAAGRTLNYALGRSGLNRRACWITNLISCRPTDNKSDTAEFQEAVECCKPGFEAELKYLAKREVRVWMPLGNVACSALGVEGGITKIRGSVYMEDGRLILPTFHPAYIVRGQWKQEVTWVNDFEKAKKLSQKKKYNPPSERFITRPTLRDLEQFLSDAREGGPKVLGVDIETTSLDPFYGKIMVVGFALDWQRAISFPFFSKGMVPYWNHRDSGRARKILQELLSFPCIFQNSLFDIPHLQAAGYMVPNLAHDTLLLHHAIHPELPHTIGYIVSVYGSTPYWKGEVLGRLGSLSEVEDEVLRTYNLRDCVVLHQVLPGLLKDLGEVNTSSVYFNISLPLVSPIIDMTRNGMLIDQDRLKKWRAKLKRTEKKLESELREVTGVPDGFSFDSGDHLRLLVYGKVANQFKKAQEELNEYEKPGCKLRRDTKKYQQICEKIQVLRETEPLYIPKGYGTRRRTASGRLSVDEEALLGVQIGVNNRLALVEKFIRPSGSHVVERENLQRTLSFLMVLRRYNENAKLLSTYSSFPVGPDGRVHPQYLIHGTRTGRLASRNPNCFPPEVEILTRRGWVRFPDLQGADSIAQWHYGSVSFTDKWTRVIEEMEGDLVRVKTGKHIDFTATKDHLCLLRERDGTLIKVRAEGYPGDHQQLHAGIYHSSKGGPEYTIRFALQADGHITREGGIDWSFHKERKATKLKEALISRGVPFRDYSKGRRFRFYVRPEDAARFLRFKSLGPWVLDCDPEFAFNELMFWDGCWTRKNNYSSNEKRNADWAQIIGSLSGRRASLRPYKERNFQVDFLCRDYSWTTHSKVEKIPYRGKVYCVVVPSHNIIVRQNGKVFVTGQSQNIPKEVRKIFVAPEGHKILQGDYSNLELRVLAYESKDDVLINTFKKGENVHDRNTKDLFQIDEDDPQWEAARRAAKIYIFGRNYGGGPQGIYQRVVKEVPELGLTFERFRQIDDSYRSKHPRYTKWVRDTLHEVTKSRTLRNAFGRIRIFLGDQHEIEREGLNFPIQSGASDIINTALISLYADGNYHKLDVRLIGQVHDSLVFEVADKDQKGLAKLLRKHMEKRINFRGEDVRFPVDIEVGTSWGELKKWTSPISNSRQKGTPSSSRNSKRGSKSGARGKR